MIPRIDQQLPGNKSERMSSEVLLIVKQGIQMQLAAPAFAPITGDMLTTETGFHACQLFHFFPRTSLLGPCVVGMEHDIIPDLLLSFIFLTWSHHPFHVCLSGWMFYRRGLLCLYRREKRSDLYWGSWQWTLLLQIPFPAATMYFRFLTLTNMRVFCIHFSAIETTSSCEKPFSMAWAVRRIINPREPWQISWIQYRNRFCRIRRRSSVQLSDLLGKNVPLNLIRSGELRSLNHKCDADCE